MFITKMSLPRRTFLQGMGATVALPLLEAMVPAFRSMAAEPVRRFMAVYVPHGKIMAQWTPSSEGAGFEFTPILKPLESFKDQLTIVSELCDPLDGHATTVLDGPRWMPCATPNAFRTTTANHGTVVCSTANIAAATR